MVDPLLLNNHLQRNKMVQKGSERSGQNAFWSTWEWPVVSGDLLPKLEYGASAFAISGFGFRRAWKSVGYNRVYVFCGEELRDTPWENLKQGKVVVWPPNASLGQWESSRHVYGLAVRVWHCRRPLVWQCRTKWSI